MERIDNDIFGFMEEFFVSVGAIVSYSNDVMRVINVPSNVQEFLGKQEPYNFSVVDTGKKNIEILTKGSFILKSMNDYLNNKGQTTLLKIDFSEKIKNIKVPIVLREGEIYKEEKKEIMDHLFRFTFLSNLQYLNNKDQIFNDIYVKGEDVMDLDLNGLYLIEGNPKEVHIDNVDYSYTVAKNYLKHKLKPDIEKLSRDLSEKLDKEIDRINSHYSNMDNEINNKIKKLDNSLAEAKKNTDLKKIDKIEKEISDLREKLNDKVKEIEKNFFITDETNKHSINLNSKLVNSTVIYYPNYKFSVHLKNGKVMRLIEFNFDPFNDKLSSIYCDSCKEPLKELYLCSSGHLSCDKCPKDRCKDCEMIVCKSCVKKDCHICNHKLCKKCDSMCIACLKSTCKMDGKPDKITGKTVCNNCGRRCCKCNEWFDNKKLKLFGRNKICETCLRLHNMNKLN